MKVAIFITSLFSLALLAASIWVGFSEFEENTTTSKIVISIKAFIMKLFKGEFINNLMNQRFIMARLSLALMLVFGLVTIILNLAK